MPHLDDGTLHALIDGALAAEAPERAVAAEDHLAACADCRARLKTAAGLRSHAAEILDATTPDVAAAGAAASPDFDEVLTRAGMGAGRGTQGGAVADPQESPAHGAAPRRRRLRRQLGWTRGLAWAATLVLALGTGYLIRDLAGPVAPEIAPTGEPAAARDRAPAMTGDANERAARADGEEAMATDRPATEVPVREAESAVRELSPPPSTESRTPPEPRVDAAAGGERGARAEDLQEPRPAGAGRGGGDSDIGAAPVPAPAPAPEGRPAELGPTEQDLMEMEVTGAAMAGAAGPVAEELSTAEPDSGRWSAITVDEARAGLDGPLYILPRAELLDVFARENAEPMEVMSRQRLESGIAIRVVQRRAESDSAAARASVADAQVGDAAAADAPAVAGQHQARMDPARRLGELETARVTHGPFVLEVSGPLPAELLTILAGAARPRP